MPLPGLAIIEAMFAVRRLELARKERKTWRNWLALHLAAMRLESVRARKGK